MENKLQNIKNRSKWRTKPYKEWRYGGISINRQNDIYMRAISEYSEEVLTADINTLGQYTGHNDKNNKEIYEDDIVENKYYGLKMTVVYQNHKFILINQKNGMVMDFSCFISDKENDLEIVGNIHDNPELLKNIGNM